MPLPGMPGSQVHNDGDMMRMIADLQRQVRELAAQNLLATAGITAQPNGITVSGSETVTGNLNVSGTQTVSGNLNVTGTETVSGNLNVSGTETVAGNLNVSGTMTASSASITGNLSQSNSYGGLTVGPTVFNNGGPGLVFTKSGVTHGAPCGIGLAQSMASNTETIIVSGPSTTNNGGFLELLSDLTFVLNGQGDGQGPGVFTSTGVNGTLTLQGGTTNGSVNLNPWGTGNCQVNGNFKVTGTKAFVMPHPLDPSKELMHAATESDRNGVEYWGEATLDANGATSVTLPAYFEALTKTTGRNIQLTPIGRTTVPVAADPISGGTFTIYGAAGQVVNWLVKAERQMIVNGYDKLEFEPEYVAVPFGPQLP